MKKVYTSVLDLIGHTPILELTGIEKKFSLQAKLYAKIERNNPAGSVKDRVAKAMTFLPRHLLGVLERAESVFG